MDMMIDYKCHDSNGEYKIILSTIDSMIIPKEKIYFLYKDILFGMEGKDNDDFINHIDVKPKLALLLYYCKWFDWFVDLRIFNKYHEYKSECYDKLFSSNFDNITLSDMERINNIDILSHEEIIDYYDSYKKHDSHKRKEDREFLLKQLKP
jgi:hypothetical protein